LKRWHRAGGLDESISSFVGRAVAITRESIPQGLKPAVVQVGNAKAKALAYLEAKTSVVYERRRSSPICEDVRRAGTTTFLAAMMV
jgi:hypothetical protein